MSPKTLIAVVLAAAATAVAAGGGAGAITREKAWCQARSGLSWRRALSRHIVPLSRRTPLTPMAIADRHSFFAEIYTKRFTGVAYIDAKTGRVTRIRAFPDPTPPLGIETGDGAVGTFDGRWLVWNEYRGQTSYDRFTTWAWNSRTRKLTRIGAATKGPNGRFWASPWRGPDVRDGIATWAQGSGPDELTQVRVYNLRTGRGRVIHTGHAQGSFLLAGHVVAWPESPERGAYTRMYAASALTGKPLRAPRALRGLRGVSVLYTDGRRVAFPTAKFKSLWWSPSLRRKPEPILRARGLDYVDNDVQIGGRYIGFGVQPRLFVADTASRRYVEISHGFGRSLLTGTTLLVAYGNGKNGKFNPITRIALVRQRDLPPVPACRRTA